MIKTVKGTKKYKRSKCRKLCQNKIALEISISLNTKMPSFKRIFIRILKAVA